MQAEGPAARLFVVQKARRYKVRRLETPGILLYCDDVGEDPPVGGARVTQTDLTD